MRRSEGDVQRPDADTDSAYNAQFRNRFTMPAAFADDGQVSGWAKDSVYFMKTNGIIDGVGSNYFAPKHDVTRDEALNCGLAAREQALKIAAGMLTTFGD